MEYWCCKSSLVFVPVLFLRCCGRCMPIYRITRNGKLDVGLRALSFIVIDVSEIGVDIGWLFDRLAVVLFRVRGQCDTIRIGIDRDLFDDEYIPGHSDRNIGTFYFEVSLSEKRLSEISSDLENRREIAEQNKI